MAENLTVNSREFLRQFKDIKEQLFQGTVVTVYIPDRKEKKVLRLTVKKEPTDDLKAACDFLRKKGKGKRVKRVDLSSLGLFRHS